MSSAKKQPDKKTAVPERESEWMSTEEAAALLGLTRETICNHCASGKIPATMLGNRWIVNRELLEKQRFARTT